MASLLLAPMALAQSGESAPMSIKSTATSKKYYRLYVDSYAGRTEAGSEADTFRRRAETASPVETYLPPRDPAMRAILRDPGQPSLSLRFDLDISPTGRVTGCRIAENDSENAQFEARLCPTLTKQLVYLPALDKNWQPVADMAGFRLYTTHWNPFRETSPPAVSNFDDMPKTALADLPDMTRPRAWPPTDQSNFVDTRPLFTNPPPIGLRDAPIAESESVAGVAIFPGDDASADCTVVIGSGNAGFDAQACAFAIETTGPQYQARKYPYLWGFPMLAIGRSQPERLAAPGGGLSHWLHLPPARADAFFGAFIPGLRAAGGDPARLVLNLTVSDQGRVTDCRIDRSSGVTAADRYACETVLETLHYEPATDAFGRARDDLDIWWSIPQHRLLPPEEG